MIFYFDGSLSLFIFIAFYCLIRTTRVETSKKHIPEKHHIIKLETELCTSSKATSTNACSTGGSGSPCKKGCMPPHVAKLGHQCDPYLYRFLRRAWDDAPPSKREWMNGLLLGARIDNINSDFEYNGDCNYYCPQMMCMSIIPSENPNAAVQWVDMTSLDCIYNDVIDRNSGVCTCGHLISLTDPVDSHRTLNNKTFIVDYQKTIGLDRRLVYDSKTRACAAERFGHCSFQWPRNYLKFATFCLSGQDIECVNRTASHLGSLFTNFKNKKGLWYGICDSKYEIEDPFAKSSVNARSLLLLTVLQAILLIK